MTADQWTALLARDDAHGATARAMAFALSMYASQLRAARTADEASGIPLLGSADCWGMPRIEVGTERVDGVGLLEPCRWRDSRDPHCRCFRCWHQGDVIDQRAALHPCSTGCWSCRRVTAQVQGVLL